MSSDHRPPRWQYYGRRVGKSLTPEKRFRLEQNLLQWSVPCSALAYYSDFSLEVGFGSGEHLVQQALRNPTHLFVGSDLFLNGIDHLVQAIKVHQLSNIRICVEDARKILSFVNFQNPGTIRSLYLLFPDPWPKARHVKRRFLQPGILESIYHSLQPKGTFRIATDHALYQAWVQELMETSSFFQPNRQDPNHRPLDWPITRYEQKALNARRPCQYWEYQKLCRGV